MNVQHTPAGVSSQGLCRIIDVDEHQILSFHHLSSAILGPLDQELVHEILRRSPSQSTIRHALLALSTQLEAFAYNHRTRCLDRMADLYSRHHYGNSLKNIQQSLLVDVRIEKQIETLLSLLLIISYEILQGNGPAALAHLEGALSILSACVMSCPKRKEDRQVLTAIRMIYCRLEIQALAFVASRAPRLTPSSSMLLQEQTEDGLIKAKSFSHSSLKLKRTTFLHLQFRALKSLNMSESRDRTATMCIRDYESIRDATRLAALVELKSWFNSFQPLLEYALHSEDMLDSQHLQMAKQCRLLHMQYLVLDLRLSAFRHEAREVVFDESIESFGTIIKHAENLMSDDSFQFFTLEAGIIEPLYFTVLKCREPQKRIAALELLASCRQEAAWDGPLMTAIARHAIYLEADLVRESDPSRPPSDVVGNSIFHTAEYIWNFRHEPEAESCRVCAAALLSIDWQIRKALVQFYHARGKLYFLREASIKDDVGTSISVQGLCSLRME